MSAGTIVITGGILAGVILLCIVAVLCYCRLQVSKSCTQICLSHSLKTKKIFKIKELFLRCCFIYKMKLLLYL